MTVINLSDDTGIPEVSDLQDGDLFYICRGRGTTPIGRKITGKNSRRAFWAGTVDVASFATGGSGTSGSPWTGWDTAITWTANTTYRFRSGYYSYVNSPAFALNGIQLIGEAGVYFQHTGRGVAFDLNNTDALNTFVNGVRVENINLVGNHATGTGTIAFSTGSANVVGTGTAFTTQLAVGDVISYQAGGSSVESHRIATITDNTHLTVEENWVGASGGTAFTYGKTTDGFYVIGHEFFYLVNCSCRDQGGYALNITASSFGEVHSFQYSIDNPTYHGYYKIKGNGIYCGTLGGQAVTTEIQFFSPEVDNFRNYGMYIAYGHSNQVFGGSFESTQSPATGVRVDGDGHYFYGVDVEGINTGYDFDIRGYCNGLMNCTGSAGLGTTMTTGTCILNTIDGGQFKTITCSGDRNGFYNVACNLASGSGFVNIGSHPTRINCVDQIGSVANIYGLATVPALDTSNNNPLNAVGSDTFAFGVSGNITFSNPTNPTAGQTIRINIISSGAGGWTVGWGNQFRVCNGVTLPTNTGATGVIKYVTATRDYSNSFWDVWQAN